jgi:3-oxoacyl-[acyl-carrier protein] reductase
MRWPVPALRYPSHMLTLDLTGRLALVTGATGDLGREIARALAECGADVAVHYHRNAAFGAELAAELRQVGVRSASFQADVGLEHSVRELQAAIQNELGVPDVLVANAVAQYEWRSMLDQPAADYQSQFETCVLQTVLLAQSFLPPLIAEIEAGRRKDGRFLAINTECAMQCFPGQSAYVAGKRGLDGLVRVLAREVGPHGITVNQIAPGWMISDRDRTRGSERQEAYEAGVPLRRRGTDRDIAHAAAFLASDLSEFISGTYLPVCGGNVMPTI